MRVVAVRAGARRGGEVRGGKSPWLRVGLEGKEKREKLALVVNTLRTLPNIIISCNV